MTLHWWMHWFWITRPAAVITQLLFIVTAVQTVPLPASTLHPQVQSNHNSRTPSAINWASENDRVSVNHQPTSVYAEHYKQTAVYESNPVWSSSPDIEEPFYPTTASSDHLLDRKQSTKNIPVTFKSISKHEFYTETYPVSHVDKSDYSSTKATEFSAIRNYVLQTDAEKPLAHTPNTVEGDSYTQVNVNLREKQSVEYPENLDHGSWKMEEPRALPLQVNTPAETIGNIVVTKRPFSLINSPNILDDDNKYNKDVNISEEQYQDNNNISKVSFPNVSISNFSENYTVPNRKHKQRLVTRDLGNISEPVFPLLASSPENNSSMQGNSSLSSNVRTGKAIGHSHALIPESLNSKSEPISTNEKINSNNRSSHYGIEKLNSNDDKTDLKENDTKNTGNQEKIDDLNPHTANSSTAVSDVKLPQQLPPIADSVLETAKTSSLESGSSKYTSNKTSDRLSFNASSLLSSANQKESKPHTNSTSSKGSIANNTQESLGKNVHDEDNSTLLDRLENIASSDTVEAGSFNPVHVHESIGRSASFSTGDGITIIPTVEPVSRSRIAASPNDINHKGLDAASITGIALGIVVFAGLTGAVSFILYRRRYLNKPQTLNDKCSNPDSSGYIDDSTLRENSEEMYSLDNDSFLNSLEAMTIQNYWTDNVKHTKL